MRGGTMLSALAGRGEAALWARGYGPVKYHPWCAAGAEAQAEGGLGRGWLGARIGSGARLAGGSGEATVRHRLGHGHALR